MKSQLIQVQNMWVDKNIFTTYFACDYEVCKGACCRSEVSGIELNGGELTAEECKYINSNRGIIASLCDEELKLAVLHKPTYRCGAGYYTSLAGRNGKCILSSNKYEACVLKKMAEVSFSIDIPVHCELYPIVVDDYLTGRDCLKLVNTFGDFCTSAFAKGEKEHIKVYQFLKRPIIRMFGEDFYNALRLTDLKLDSSTL